MMRCAQCQNDNPSGANIQDVAYQSLLRSTRQQYHQRIARVLAEQFPETVET
jgi:predicted ATPase